jgi:hypothetical protein
VKNSLQRNSVQSLRKFHNTTMERLCSGAAARIRHYSPSGEGSDRLFVRRSMPARYGFLLGPSRARFFLDPSRQLRVGGRKGRMLLRSEAIKPKPAWTADEVILNTALAAILLNQPRVWASVLRWQVVLSGSDRRLSEGAACASVEAVEGCRHDDANDKDLHKAGNEFSRAAVDGTGLDRRRSGSDLV